MDIKLSKSFASEADTLAYGKYLGKKLRGGEVIELAGDIGSGKTTFVKGLARGTGSSDPVTSPTFVIQQQYQGNPIIYHYDFYRLDNAGIMAHEVREALSAKDTAVVVEWAHTIAEVLPKNRLKITIGISGDKSRQFDIYIPKALIYLK